MKKQRTKEQQREFLYHINCEAQYVSAAEKLANEKMKARALANAQFHRERAARIQQTTEVRS